MAQNVRAVYEGGRLRALDPVDLTEGEQVRLMILDERERARAALGDLLAGPEPDSGDTTADAALLAEIDASVRGQVSASEAIIEERRAGP